MKVYFASMAKRMISVFALFLLSANIVFAADAFSFEEPSDYYSDNYDDGNGSGSSIVAGGESLRFMEVPITGTVDAFAANLIAKGFRYEEKLNNGNVLMSGSFAGFGDCNVFIASEKGRVKKVSVFLSDHYVWSTLFNNYLQIKNMLSMEYGNPDAEVGRFSSDNGWNSTDDAKMYDLQTGGAKFYSMWEKDAGYVTLEITYRKGAGARVSIIYEIA